MNVITWVCRLTRKTLVDHMWPHSDLLMTFFTVNFHLFLKECLSAYSAFQIDPDSSIDLDDYSGISESIICLACIRIPDLVLKWIQGVTCHMSLWFISLFLSLSMTMRSHENVFLDYSLTQHYAVTNGSIICLISIRIVITVLQSVVWL